MSYVQPVDQSDMTVGVCKEHRYTALNNDNNPYLEYQYELVLVSFKV